MEQSIIYVQNSEGQPLMSTRRRNKVWYWLRTGQARVISREPFTIRLRFETTSYIQAVNVGIDTGSKVVGIAAITNGEVAVQAEVHLRDDITQKMTQRRQYRHARRSRKTRYRAARWANRRRKAGWLPPSLRSKADATVKAVRFVASLLPVSQVNVEVGSFDTQKMQNPEISGVSYQQGELSGYLVRQRPHALNVGAWTESPWCEPAARPDADQPPGCSHPGAVVWECPRSDPGIAFPVPGSPIPRLNRLMGCPKPVPREDGRQPHTGEENITIRSAKQRAFLMCRLITRPPKGENRNDYVTSSGGGCRAPSTYALYSCPCTFVVKTEQGSGVAPISICAHLKRGQI